MSNEGISQQCFNTKFRREKTNLEIRTEAQEYSSGETKFPELGPGG